MMDFVFKMMNFALNEKAMGKFTSLAACKEECA